MLYVVRFHRKDGSFDDTIAMPEVPMDAVNNTMKLDDFIKYEIIEKTEKEVDEELDRWAKEVKRHRKSIKRQTGNKLH